MLHHVIRWNVEPAIFANKPLDVRLPKPLVNLINERIKEGDLFSVCFLTSRSYRDALFILQESGVQEVEKLMLVSDSGNVVLNRFATAMWHTSLVMHGRAL